MMLFSELYEANNAHYLRDLLSYGICNSFNASTEAKMKYPALPTSEDVVAANCHANLYTSELIEGINLSTDDITSFYPLAEAFMAKRAVELN